MEIGGGGGVDVREGQASVSLCSAKKSNALGEALVRMTGNSKLYRPFGYFAIRYMHY